MGYEYQPFSTIEPDLQPVNKALFERLEEAVEMSRLDMSEAEVFDQFNTCVEHCLTFDEIVEEFQELIEDHNEY